MHKVTEKWQNPDRRKIALLAKVYWTIQLFAPTSDKKLILRAPVSALSEFTKIIPRDYSLGKSDEKAGILRPPTSNKLRARITTIKGQDQRPYVFAFGLIATLLLSFLFVSPAFSKAFNLETVKQQVMRDYKGVSHLQTSELQKFIADKKDVLIFDVREENEFNVSHIPGAVRLSPSTWGWTFLREYGDNVKGRTVIFYCSVGVRSSIMAARVQEGLSERGAEKIYNLNGGIFAWHNENRTLVNAKGNTSFVHPYDKHWGSLLSHQSKTRMSPIN